MLSFHTLGLPRRPLPRSLPLYTHTESASLPPDGAGPDPVSYTHLDVYKRQHNGHLDVPEILQALYGICGSDFPVTAKKYSPHLD